MVPQQFTNPPNCTIFQLKFLHLVPWESIKCFTKIREHYAYTGPLTHSLKKKNEPKTGHAFFHKPSDYHLRFLAHTANLLIICSGMFLKTSKKFEELTFLWISKKKKDLVFRHL